MDFGNKQKEKKKKKFKQKQHQNGPRLFGCPGPDIFVKFRAISGDFIPQQKSGSAKIYLKQIFQFFKRKKNFFVYN